MEQNILTRLMLSFNSRTDSVSATSEIRKRVLRSLSANAAPDERDKKMRTEQLRKILRSIFRVDGSTKGIFPNFGYHPEWRPEEQYGIPIPADEVKKIGQKIIKGIEYKLEKRYVDSSFILEVYFCYEDRVRNVSNLIQRNGQRYVIAPGFEFYRSAQFGKKYCLYEIRIWDKFVIYGSLMKKRWWRLLFDFNFIRFKLFSTTSEKFVSRVKNHKATD